MTNMSDDYEENDEEEDENEEDDEEEYYTEDGLPKLSREFYSGFLDKMSKRDPNKLLEQWVERMGNSDENSTILEHAVLSAGNFPEEYQDRVVFSVLSLYELLRERAKELCKILDNEMEREEDGKFKFYRYDNSEN